MASRKVADPFSLIDFSSLEPPPPPPEEDLKMKDEERDEPVYYGENIRAMIMASDTVQLGKLTIITELGCIIGSGQQAQIRIQEDHVQPRHVVIQHRTVPSLEPNPETYFEVQFHAFGQLNGQLKPAEHCERVKHMDRLKIGTTIIILHVHEPGETCDACRSGDIISELPETLQSGMLNGEMQKAFLDKSEAERIREFYNFDRYCWGPGMSKAAQEEVARREEKKTKKKLEETKAKLDRANEIAARKEKGEVGKTKRLGSKAFPGMKNIGQDRDPVALAWYNDATGEGEVGPDKPNISRREYVPRSRKRRKQMMEASELERAAVKYDEKQQNRVWY